MDMLEQYNKLTVSSETLYNHTMVVGETHRSGATTQ